MEKILTFDSTGAALNGEERLKAAGIPVRVMARPNALGAQCGFCLRLDPEDLARALGVLRAANLTVRGVYDMAPALGGGWSYAETPLDQWATD
ncbi:MAG: DUF3343 domain-containing protein [Deltaproteobacteria bacterium]|jgi:hypothetical protein|nr:DUF3343 domain-containing protein [Deltaproteobacteria bacterium]